MSCISAGHQPSNPMQGRHINSQLGATSAPHSRILVTVTRKPIVNSTRVELQERAKQAQSEFDFTRLAVELRGAGGWLLLRNWTVKHNAVPWTFCLTSSVQKIARANHTVHRWEPPASPPGSLRVAELAVQERGILRPEPEASVTDYVTDPNTKCGAPLRAPPFPTPPSCRCLSHESHWSTTATATPGLLHRDCTSACASPRPCNWAGTAAAAADGTGECPTLNQPNTIYPLGTRVDCSHLGLRHAKTRMLSKASALHARLLFLRGPLCTVCSSQSPHQLTQIRTLFTLPNAPIASLVVASLLQRVGLLQGRYYCGGLGGLAWSYNAAAVAMIIAAYDTTTTAASVSMTPTLPDPRTQIVEPGKNWHCKPRRFQSCCLAACPGDCNGGLYRWTTTTSMLLTLMLRRRSGLSLAVQKLSGLEKTGATTLCGPLAAVSWFV